MHRHGCLPSPGEAPGASPAEAGLRSILVTGRGIQSPPTPRQRETARERDHRYPGTPADWRYLCSREVPGGHGVMEEGPTPTRGAREGLHSTAWQTSGGQRDQHPRSPCSRRGVGKGLQDQGCGKGKRNTPVSRTKVRGLAAARATSTTFHS